MSKAAFLDKKLFRLFLPIFFETFFLMLAGMVDTFMLSHIGDEAVGAVGSANTYLGLFFIFFAIISSGLIAVMTQYIGHGKKGVAVEARNVSVFINGGIGLALALILGLAARPIIDALGVSEALRPQAALYLSIVGGGCVLDALIPVFSCYLRAFDKSRMSLVAAFSGNIVNVVFDVLAVFVIKSGPFSGVGGVAIGTVIGKSVNILLSLLFGRIFVHGGQYEERENLKRLVKSILRVGFPAALETAIYSAAMGVAMIFVGQMDVTGFNSVAKTYAQQISSFAYCFSFALAQANVIIVGWNIGKGELKACYRSTRNAALIALGAGVLIELLLASISPLILDPLVTDKALVTLVRNLLFLDIALEIGRAANLVYGTTLKSTGDSVYPAVLALIFNALFIIGGSYLFGVVCGWQVLGVFVGFTLDEVTRAGLMIMRWCSGKWEAKVLVKAQEKPLVIEEE